jgi:pimeloyl-ACP methyl ester carboxylesterase
MTNAASTPDSLAGLAVTRWEPPCGAARPEAWLLLVHGGFHAGWYWTVWGPALAARGWRCAAVDLPGHGGSRLSGGRLARQSVRDYAAAVRRAADALGPGCVLVGHSLGGLVAQVVGSAGRIAAQVLVCPSPLAAVARLRFPLVPTGRPVPPPDLEGMRSRWFRRPPHKAVGNLGAVHRRLGPESPVALNERYTNQVDAPRSTCPTLVIGTQADPRHEDGRLERRTAAYHRDADLLMHASHGHDLCVEEGTEEVLGQVAAWLEEQSPHRHRRRCQQ